MSRPQNKVGSYYMLIFLLIGDINNAMEREKLYFSFIFIKKR